MTRIARVRLFAALAAAIVAAGACSDNRTLTPKSTDLTTLSGLNTASVRGPDVRISEFHYDNPGTDVNETIEISGPAGTDLTGWSVVLYDGHTGVKTSYSTTALSGVIPATCADRGVVLVSPSGGLQNGHPTSSTSNIDPDGIALMHGSTVVDVIAYEGTV